MVKLKEFFNVTSRDASNLGSMSFRWSLDKESVKTPHYMMNKVLEMLEGKPHLSTGLRQHVRFLLNEIKFQSDDPKSVQFMTNWYQARKGLNDEIFKFTYMLVGCGTSYMEPTWLTMKGNKKVLDNLFSVPDPSIMYRNLEVKADGEDYWLMRLPILVREFNGKTPKYWPVYYIKGSVFYRELIWAISNPKDKYVCETFGWSRTPFYGYGLLSPAIDNADIEEEILKNWALQAKFRSIGKKIIGFYNSDQTSVSPDELNQIRTDFQSLEEEDSLLTNKRFDQASLSFANEDITMQEQIGFLRRDTGASLVPNFMTAMSQDSSMATASESKIPFSFELKAEQIELIKILNRLIIEPLRKSYAWLAPDLTVSLPSPELYSRSEVFQMALELYNRQGATLNELRLAGGFQAVEGGDVWGSKPPLDKMTIRIDPSQGKMPTSGEMDKMTTVMKESYKHIRPEKTIKEAIVNVKIGEPEKVKKESVKNAVKDLLK